MNTASSESDIQLRRTLIDGTPIRRILLHIETFGTNAVERQSFPLCVTCAPSTTTTSVGVHGARTDAKEIAVTTPDHADNTGDNLRHAAELQDRAKSDPVTELPTEDVAPESPLPDFNT